ncbi:MAG: chemotaxis-specific protein-glutamate methyltransferase CheB [Lachnospiraceae bacterium]|nr:chemotaxis-specific protein-glutamate methyltransferase CheB [Lachnospiraceae bacterium]
MKKKILIIDDSALMRRVFCDIINADDRFEVVNTASDGAEGFKFICQKDYDAVVLDVYMPKMTGLQLLEEMQKSRVSARILMASTTTGEGARETIDALSLGAIDFIKKPENVANARVESFSKRFLDLLNIVANAPMPRFGGALAASKVGKSAHTFTTRYDVNFHTTADKLASARTAASSTTAAATAYTHPAGALSSASGIKLRKVEHKGHKKIVAIASSTGGPRALQDVIPYLPANLPVPVLLVQHMPQGFTASLADRLNEISKVRVSEAKSGEMLAPGHVYIAPGGKHMKVEKKGGSHYIKYSDEPTREGVKPCANYMYESLIDCDYDEVICVVLTGMGADGTAGIKNLDLKKQTYIIAQDQDSSTVYGMPKAIALTGLVSEIVPLKDIAEHITKNVGVR